MDLLGATVGWWKKRRHRDLLWSLIDTSSSNKKNLYLKKKKQQQQNYSARTIWSSNTGNDSTTEDWFLREMTMKNFSVYQRNDSTPKEMKQINSIGWGRREEGKQRKFAGCWGGRRIPAGLGRRIPVGAGKNKYCSKVHRMMASASGFNKWRKQ